MNSVLFLCTGNYYRSRFAELLFNHLAARSGLRWRAFSRALALERGINNIGPISAYVLEGLKQRGIPSPENIPIPQQLQEIDLEIAQRVIALHEPEHRPLIEKRFPGWLASVEYWRAPDLDRLHPDQALAYINAQVNELLVELSESG